MTSLRPRPTTRHRGVVLAVLCVSLLVIGIDNTILNVALPTLARSMHATQSQLQWIVDAYAIVFAGLLLAAGSAGDRFGRRRLLILGLAVFGAGSAASAFVTTPTALSLTRGLMGIGGALIMPATLSIITNVFTEPRERARAIGLWSATSGLGIAIGPIAGGLLLSRFWWGSVFLVNVPIVLFGMLGALLLVPASKSSDVSRPDPAGVVLSVLALGTLLWAIIEAPTRGWTSVPVAAALAAAAVLLATFLVVEARSDHPMLRLTHFRSRRFSAAATSNALVFFALFGALFLLTEYFQFVIGYSALSTGLRVAPVALAMGVMSALAPRVERRLGSKLVVAVGLGAVAAALWWLSTATTAAGYPSLLGMIVVLGAGMGFALPVATEAIMGSLPRDEAGVGSATNGTLIQVGGALGVAVLGSLLQGRYSARISGLLSGHSVPAGISAIIHGSIAGAVGVAHSVGGPTGKELAAGAATSYVSGMHLALLVGSAGAVAGALVALAFLPARADASGAEDVEKEPAVPSASPTRKAS